MRTEWDMLICSFIHSFHRPFCTPSVCLLSFVLRAAEREE